MVTSLRPSWRHCALGADSADPVGCRGIKIPGHDSCLTHLGSADRAGYLAALRPGTDLDVRGTSLSSPLLDDLLDAVRDPGADDRPVLGTTRFDHVAFGGTAKFDGVHFRGDVRFKNAVFTGDAWFEGTTFFGSARFSNTQFEGDAQFNRAHFHDAARFHETVFRRGAGFGGVRFDDDALFAEVSFSGNSNFHHASFGSTSRFVNTTFCGGASFAEASFIGSAGFPGARFSGAAGFNQAQFAADADFGGVIFAEDANFQCVVFDGAAEFSEAAFSGKTWFEEGTFTQVAGFGGATFSGDTMFGKTIFHAIAAFDRARFGATAAFDRARFEAAADFSAARCLGDASFNAAEFQAVRAFGPVTCTGRLNLDQATFTAPVTVQAGAVQLSCVGTRFEGPTTLRVRFAAVDLSEAVLTQPILVTSTRQTQLEPGEALLAFGREVTASVISIHRVDAALLMLSDIDLSRCVFVGAHHLDQLRLAGEYDFAGPPPGLRWGLPVPVRWTARQVLAEEHHWRSLALHRPAAREGWIPGPQGIAPDPAPVPGPATLTVLYRQLRKAFEDGKDEPGAADFYYGEMEMRRHDRRRTHRAERSLLHAYWLLSGYGLRASRSLGWLIGTMTATILALMLWGLPNADAQSLITGTQPPAGQHVALTVESPDPTLTGSLADRISGNRAEQALRVVLNSVVFRSSGQGLTTAGTYIEMTSRFAEPTLLALAVLAVRSRVKR
ncbi:pentapeptide repeat-containing protein [Streptomyces sp. NPDC054794]